MEALKMKDGKEVWDINELHKNFDLTQAMKYYDNGGLLKWLTDLGYEDEEEAVRALASDSPNIREELCTALGIEYSLESEMDEEELTRLEAKKKILLQKGADDEMLAVAVQTALSQRDLANLWKHGVNVIYLCGEEFSIPLREEGKTYIGILGTPRIKTKATNDMELKDKKIIFRNVILPWKVAEQKSEPNTFNSVKTESKTEAPVNSEADETKEYLREVFEMCFGFMPDDVWYSTEKPSNAGYVSNVIPYISTPGTGIQSGNKSGEKIISKNGLKNLTDAKKKAILSNLCFNKYTEDDLIYVKVSNDFLEGWVLTIDSICIASKYISEHNDGRCVIYPYSNIKVNGATTIIPSILIDSEDDDIYRFSSHVCFNSMDKNDIAGLLRYLQLVKNVGR